MFIVLSSSQLIYLIVCIKINNPLIKERIKVGKIIRLQYGEIVSFPLTFMVDLIMNLICGLHHKYMTRKSTASLYSKSTKVGRLSPQVQLDKMKLSELNNFEDFNGDPQTSKEKQFSSKKMVLLCLCMNTCWPNFFQLTKLYLHLIEQNGLDPSNHILCK